MAANPQRQQLPARWLSFVLPGFVGHSVCKVGQQYAELASSEWSAGISSRPRNMTCISRSSLAAHPRAWPSPCQRLQPRPVQSARGSG